MGGRSHNTNIVFICESSVENFWNVRCVPKQLRLSKIHFSCLHASCMPRVPECPGAGTMLGRA